MEKAKTRKIKKWDEVHGEYEVEVSEDTSGSGPDEVTGAGPSISRNPMRQEVPGFLVFGNCAAKVK